MKTFLLVILPHGIFEITTFLVIGLMIFLTKKGDKIKKRYFGLAYSGLVFSAFFETAFKYIPLLVIIFFVILCFEVRIA